MAATSSPSSAASGIRKHCWKAATMPSAPCADSKNRTPPCARDRQMRSRTRPALAVLLGLVALSGSAPAAEPYPDRPITMIVPYAAGGSSDVLARLIGERLAKSLGAQIVVDNRAGAGSRLGTELAAKA